MAVTRTRTFQTSAIFDKKYLTNKIYVSFRLDGKETLLMGTYEVVHLRTMLCDATVWGDVKEEKFGVFWMFNSSNFCILTFWSTSILQISFKYEVIVLLTVYYNYINQWFIKMLMFSKLTKNPLFDKLGFFIQRIKLGRWIFFVFSKYNLPLLILQSWKGAIIRH